MTTELMRFLLGKGSPPAGSDGRVDFRKAAVCEGPGKSRKSSSRPEKVSGRDIRDADLSSATLDNIWIEGCVITNVRFDRASLSQVNLRDSTFIQCSFDGAKFSQSNISTHDGHCLFEDCTFSKAKLGGETIQSATFKSCAFVDADLDDTCFYACVFEQCRFAGELSFTRIAARPLDDRYADRGQFSAVSFEEATLNCIDFPGMDLTDVRLPPQSTALRVQNYQPVLEKLIHSYASSSTRESALIQEILLQSYEAAIADNVRVGIIDLTTFAANGVKPNGLVDLSARLRAITH